MGSGEGKLMEINVALLQPLLRVRGLGAAATEGFVSHTSSDRRKRKVPQSLMVFQYSLHGCCDETGPAMNRD